MQITSHRLVGVPYKAASLIGRIIDPKFVVIHYTAGYTAQSAIGTFAAAGAKVSAHIVMERDGTMTQMVPFNCLAAHAGPSQYQGYEMLNGHSIGIEIVNIGWARKQSDGRLVDSYGNIVPARLDPDSWIAAPHPRVGSGMLYWQPFTKEQIDTTIDLVKALIPAYDLKAAVTHEEIDTRGWKTDPGPAFPMSRIRALFRGVEQNDVVGLTYTVNPEALNMRSGPGTSNGVVAVLKRGERVRALEEASGWAKVDAAGRVGWVRRDLVT